MLVSSTKGTIGFQRGRVSMSEGWQEGLQSPGSNIRADAPRKYRGARFQIRRGRTPYRIVRVDESILERHAAGSSPKRDDKSTYYPLILILMAAALLLLSRYVEVALGASPNYASLLLYTICVGCSAILVLLALWSLAIDIRSDINRFRARRRTKPRSGR